MAVKGSATVTLSQYRDTDSVTRYYKLQPSSLAAPDKPTNVKPDETPAGWSKSEPACDITMSLYTVDVTVFSDSTTHVSDVSKSTSYEAAKEAYNKASHAQNSANEAAKKADNYISSDESGIMVSENTGEVKELPQNATKNNVLITEKDVQIRNGRTILSSYGENTIIGDLTKGNINIKPNTIELRDGNYVSASIKTVKIAETNSRSTQNFDGQGADNAVMRGETWTATYSLGFKPGRIKSVTLLGPNIFDMELPDSRYGMYGYWLSGDEVIISLDGSYGETKSYEWFAYDTVIIEFTTAERTTGVITSEEVYANNVFVRNPNKTYVSILDFIYPVGSIYMSVNAATNPGELIGGTWERIKDRFLLSAGDTYAAGNTGGSAKATLPSHTHTFGSGGYQMWGAKIGTGSTEPGSQISGDAKYYAAVKGKSTSNYKWLESVDSKGVSDVSQANMPPYLAVYVWKRIS